MKLLVRISGPEVFTYPFYPLQRFHQVETAIVLLMAQEQPKDGYMFDSNDFDLDAYIRFRPQYTERLFKEIYDYHGVHGGQWQLAHDAGTGAGVVVEKLLKKFEVVAASDSSAQYVAVSQQRLFQLVPAERLRFSHHPAEDMSWLPPSSVDLITIAEAVHWTQTDVFLKSAADVLKPGGTVAILNYGTLPYAVEKPEAQKILEDIHDYFAEEVLKNLPKAHLEKFERVFEIVQSRTNAIAVSEGLWKPGVKRIQWNADKALPLGPNVPIIKVDPNSSSVGPNDVVENKMDDDVLTIQADAQWVKGIGKQILSFGYETFLDCQPDFGHESLVTPMAQGDTIDFELYRYTPSVAAAALFVVLFTLTTLYHVYQAIRRRTIYFTAFIIGGIFQIIGYICRIIAHSQKASIPVYSIQTILILLAPPLYAASIYMVLGRLIVYLRAEKFSLVSVSWMTKVFVTGDVIAFAMQAAGGGIMASGTINSYKLGERITIGGLCVQLAFFSFFVITCALFHYRIRSNPTQRLMGLSTGIGTRTVRTWENVLVGLYAASSLILVRSIFRLIEYAQGNSGYLISHEAFMYVFDSTLMFLAMVAMNICHPSIILVGSQKQRDSEMSFASDRELQG
ncbi:RTA1 like protein [Paecilomyces variotii No. 5]|uniref:RTA1 like protein n=1 Tax=Byssochlamys spectabilis (strain No. 5 / NBRC 109023) TaxID=1356009 RepID=V5G6H6_BYSSN|nr:RTA1 like protein [Paecilomyces variotii No. 5]